MRTPAKILAWLALAILVACGQGDSGSQAKKFGGGGNGGFQPGPGLTQCSHDGTLTGNCTAALPLSVIGAAGSGSATFSAITDTGPLGVSGTSTLAGVTATSLSDSGPLILTGSIAPTALAGSVNNYAPCDVTTPANCLATTNLVRQDASVASTVTGLAAQASGQAVALLNISAANSITLTNEDTNSTAPNRFTLPNGASWVIPPGGAVLLRYSSATSRWRPEHSNNNNVMATALANAGSTVLSGTQTDSFTTTQNDYALGTSVTRLAWNGTSSANLQGIAGGVDGRILVVENLAGGNTLNLSGENAGSLAANRITGVGGSSSTTPVTGNGQAILIYDATAQRWRVLALASAQWSGTMTFGGTVTFNSAALLSNAIRMGGVLSPTALTGATQNDYTGGGCTGISAIRQDVNTADTTITGLSCTQSSQLLMTLTNISATNNLILTNEDVGSTAANRFLLDGGSSCVLYKGTSMTFRYDSTSLRWRGMTPCPSSTQTAYPNATITTTDTGTQNDYNPTGLGNASIIRLNPASALTITGIAGGTDGRQLFLCVVNAGSTTFSNENAGSIAANRILGTGNNGIQLNVSTNPNACLTLVYDGVSSRWRAMAFISNQTLQTMIFSSAVAMGSANNKGTITLSAGTGTATVASGSVCTCTDTSTTPTLVGCSVSSTTLTAKGTSTDVIAYHCF